MYSTLSLTVVEGAGPSLLGRDWLVHLTLDWKTIGLATLDMSRTQVEALQKKYRDVFSPGLGVLKIFKAHISVKQGARPVFHRPRSVPFALKEAIEVELARLESEGVIEKVNQRDWAALIVAVPKSIGRRRICEDNKVTVNPHIEPDRHPLLKPDDLFASLSGGKKFIKIHLSHAYLQMMLDDEFIVINHTRDCTNIPVCLLAYHLRQPFFSGPWIISFKAYPMSLMIYSSQEQQIKNIFVMSKKYSNIFKIMASSYRTISVPFWPILSNIWATSLTIKDCILRPRK